MISIEDLKILACDITIDLIEGVPTHITAEDQIGEVKYLRDYTLINDEYAPKEGGPS